MSDAEPSASAPSTVLVDIDGQAGIATITLNRPEALNALTVPMKRELLIAFRQVEREPGVRAVILTGAGRAFCAGQDLRERLQPDAAPLGVEVRERKTAQISRPGASKVVIEGGGTVRFQNVYMLRRYRFSPSSTM